MDHVARGSKRKTSNRVPAQREASSDSERSNEMTEEDQEEEALVATGAGPDAAEKMPSHKGGLSSRQCPAPVKVEGEEPISSLSSAAVAVRRTTGGNNKRHRAGAASQLP
eukprot:g14885.t1